VEPGEGGGLQDFTANTKPDYLNVKHASSLAADEPETNQLVEPCREQFEG